MCKNAQRRAAEAEVLLRDVELVAIKGGILNDARALIAQADEAKVERWAPRTLQAAKRLSRRCGAGNSAQSI